MVGVAVVAQVLAVDAVEQVLDQDHRAVHDDAEIDRAHREQVGRHAARIQIQERGEKRQGDHRGDDEGGLHREHEHEQHEDDQEGSLEEIVEHGAQGGLDELGPIVEGPDTGPLRQDAIVDVTDPLAQRLQDDRGVLAPAHQDDPLHRVLVGVARHDPLAGGVSDRHPAHVPDGHGHAPLRSDAHLLDVPQVLEDAEAPDDEHLAASLDVATRGVVAPLPQRFEDVGQTDLERRHPRRVRLDVDLAQKPAVRHDVRNARDAQKLGPHHPVLLRAQGHRVGALALERVAVDLADGRRQGTEGRLNAGGELGPRQTLQDLLPGEEGLNTVLEGQGHERQPEERDAAQAEQARHAVQDALERDRDAALHLLGRLAGKEGDDLHLRVGRVGESLDGELREGVVAARGQDRGQDKRGEPVLQRLAEEGVEHPGDRPAARRRGRPGCPEAGRPPPRWSRRAPGRRGPGRARRSTVRRRSGGARTVPPHRARRHTAACRR